jgi:hypothetical protein
MDNVAGTDFLIAGFELRGVVQSRHGSRKVGEPLLEIAAAPFNAPIRGEQAIC